MNPVRLKAPGLHSELILVRLNPGSDSHNNPVQTLTYLPRREVTARGKIFFVRSRVSGRSLVIVSSSPDCTDASVTLTNTGEVNIDPAGCDLFTAECPLGDEEKTLRSYFRGRCGTGLFSLLNNWGDGSKGRNISESFYYKEIDAAAALGLDAVQIDDGWQAGDTFTTQVMDENGNYSGYHTFDGGYWEVNREKFPGGLAPLAEYAAAKGITLGLWFAPDARDHFANAGRDAAVLKKAYDLGFRYFKLDMIIIRDAADRDAFVGFLEKLRSLCPEVSLQLDVTGDQPRLGFTDGCGFGKTFVENRYAWWGDHFPYLTLRALWQLSRYFPACRFQFELPNTGRFADQYDPADPLAAVHYSPAWKFASVMVSCPLFWMEAQHLAPEDADSLRIMTDLWKEHRDRLAAADVRPAGAEPDGFSLTGFIAEGGDHGYLIALREAGEESVFAADLPAGAKLRLLASSDGVSCAGNTVTLPEKYGWAFCIYNK